MTDQSEKDISLKQEESLHRQSQRVKGMVYFMLTLAVILAGLAFFH